MPNAQVDNSTGFIFSTHWFHAISYLRSANLEFMIVRDLVTARTALGDSRACPHTHSTLVDTERIPELEEEEDDTTPPVPTVPSSILFDLPSPVRSSTISVHLTTLACQIISFLLWFFSHFTTSGCQLSDSVSWFRRPFLSHDTDCQHFILSGSVSLFSLFMLFCLSFSLPNSTDVLSVGGL